MTKEELEEALKRLPLADLQVTVSGRVRHLVAEVVSPDFQGIVEFERQQIVWEFLVSELSDDQRSTVDFVFTRSPEEIVRQDQELSSQHR
jgi:acid stress-induced BolA-like protein IbaG/YrbA